jgi:hypothetical protein
MLSLISKVGIDETDLKMPGNLQIHIQVLDVHQIFPVHTDFFEYIPPEKVGRCRRVKSEMDQVIENLSPLEKTVVIPGYLPAILIHKYGPSITHGILRIFFHKIDLQLNAIRGKIIVSGKIHEIFTMYLWDKEIHGSWRTDVFLLNIPERVVFLQGFDYLGGLVLRIVVNHDEFNIREGLGEYTVNSLGDESLMIVGDNQD